MQNHLISSLKVEVNFTKEGNYLGLQNEVANAIQFDILPKLEKLFDDITPNGELLRLDKLDINLGTLPENNWEEQLTELFIKQMYEQLHDKVAENNVIYIEEFTKKEANSSAKKNHISLLNYLEKGVLPWFEQRSLELCLEDLLIEATQGSIEVWQAFQDAIGLNSIAKKRWLQILNSYNSVWEIYQDQYLLKQELFKGSNSLNIEKSVWIELMEISDFNFTTWNESLISVYLEKRNDLEIPQLKHLWKNLSIDLNPETPIFEEDELNSSMPNLSNEDRENSEIFQEEGAGNVSNNFELEHQANQIFFIENAGLVILHPYLSFYFKNLKLTDSKEFHNEVCISQALILSYYLTHGALPKEESMLALNKFICGVELDFVVDFTVPIPTEFLEEADELLKTTIQHWGALGNSSVAGLRETFLQRKGKLQLSSDKATLLVERKGFDVLLGKLPWTISIIKSNWNPEPLYVEW